MSSAILLAIAVLLAAALLRPGEARAEATVKIGPAEASEALFVAGDVSRLSAVPAGTKDVILEEALQQLYADEPELAPATAEGDISKMEALLEAPSAPSNASLQLMAGNQRIIAILAALERAPESSEGGLPAPAKLAVTHLAADALSGSADIFAKAEVPKYFEPFASARTNLTFTSFSPTHVLRATHQLASRDKLFGQARDALWGKASEESVFSEWRQLLAESAVLRSPALKALREAIEAGGGTLTEEPAALAKLFSESQKTTQEQSCAHGAGEEEIGGETIEGLPRLKCSGGALYEDAHTPRRCTEKSRCEAELKELAAKDLTERQIIDEERATMVAAAELLRPSDNKAAELQAATAQAQAQISEEETAYANYEAEQAEKQAIAGGVKEGLEGSAAALALATGNYSEGMSGLIGVGFELYENAEGALSNPPPGPQEITLQDLADISTQLSGFQQYTQEAFHAINTQLAQLSAQLARENYELKQELSALGERLERVQGTIYALQDEVKELFAAETKANLQSTIEDSIGWLARTGEPLSGPKVQEALVALKKFGTEIAKSSLVNAPETQPFTFEGAYRQLTSKTTGEPSELGEDVGYLARFPSEQGWVTTLAPSSLANTVFWSESGQAYGQLMLENASHVTAPDVAGLDELEREGANLEKAESAWSAHSGGSGSRTGNAILDHAISDVEEAAYGKGLDGGPAVQSLLSEQAQKSFETALEKALKTTEPNPTGLTLWGGAKQAFSARSVAEAQYPALKWSECSGSEGKNGTVAMPESFIESLPPSLIDGVRLGVIGAPKSGAPLTLQVCRKITKKESNGATIKSERYEEPCSVDVGNDCNVFYEAEATEEYEEESVTEQLTLKRSETGETIAESSVAECKQTALFWKGKGYFESWDPTTKGAYGFEVKHTALGGSFENERHVGTIDRLYWTGKTLNWEYTGTALQGGHCPYEGSVESAGIEYANYAPGESPFTSSEEPQVVEAIDGLLRELQEKAYGEGLKALEQNPPESLGGARALVQSYVKLGLPQAVGSDPELQSDVEGLGAQFLDPEPGIPRSLPAEVEALVGSWIHRLKESSSTGLEKLLEDDLIGEVKQRAQAWISQIAEQVKPYIEGKVTGFGSSAEPVSEQPALVESALNRLQLTRDVLSEARAPSAETLTPVGLGRSEATLRAEVAPDGGAVESCLFEYGSTESYGQSIECSTVPKAGEKAAIVTAKVTNWTPEGSFHERIVVKTWGGTSYGQDVKVQLAQATKSPSGGLILMSTDTPGATIGKLQDEALPEGTPLPTGAAQLVGMISFTVNVTPGGSARVRIELPSGDVPTALYKLLHKRSGGEEYVEVPASVYTIAGNVIELTLVDGGPDDEDGEANGVIVDPLVPVVLSSAKPTSPSAPSPSPTPPAKPSTAKAPHVQRKLPPECVSDGLATIRPGELRLPAGARIERSEIIVDGKVVAILGPGSSAAIVSFAPARKGPYRLTVLAKLTNGHTIRRQIVLHPCGRAARSLPTCLVGSTATVRLSALKLPRGVEVRRADVIINGRVIAQLSAHGVGAIVNVGRQQKGGYTATLVAKLSNGHTLRRRLVFKSCSRHRR